MRWSPISHSAAALLVAAILSSCGGGAPRIEVDDAQREAELKPDFPAYPDPQKLLRVDLGPLTSNEFWIDPESISIAPGDTVIYTMVVRSPEGASNVTFEALRCRPTERRIFALGRSNGTWVPSQRNVWLPVPRSEPAYLSLAEDFFCPARRAAKTPDEVIRAVRLRGHPEARPRD